MTSTARLTLPAQLDRVEAGEQIEITRHGKVIAALVSPHALRARRAADAWARADQVKALLDQARTEPLRTPTMTEDRAEELIEAIRTGRSGR